MFIINYCILLVQISTSPLLQDVTTRMQNKYKYKWQEYVDSVTFIIVLSTACPGRRWCSMEESCCGWGGNGRQTPNVGRK